MRFLNWFVSLFQFKRDEEPQVVQERPADFQIFLYHPFDPLGDDEILHDDSFFYGEDHLDNDGLM